MPHRFALPACLCLALAGCGALVAGGATTAKPGPIAAILIVEKPSRVLATGSQKDFTDGLAGTLQTCHVRTTVQVLDELSLSNGGSDEETLDVLIRSQRPDAVLTLAPGRSVIGQSFNSTRFEARLIEVSSHKVVWRGQAVVRSGLALGEANSQIGADLIHVMAASGVLRTCPT